MSRSSGLAAGGRRTLAIIGRVVRSWPSASSSSASLTSLRIEDCVAPAGLLIGPSPQAACSIAGRSRLQHAAVHDHVRHMITKVEPWADDFGDGNATDEWLASEGTWSVVSGAAQNTSSASVYPGLQLASK